mmetsp:Transcript_36900/g.90820  ORF Transcript_36900/g.90820 Transcript_36900/m.90820 type:complete len:409 (-) Transcript_36900:32-1258(-)
MQHRVERAVALPGERGILLEEELDHLELAPLCGRVDGHRGLNGVDHAHQSVPSLLQEHCQDLSVAEGRGDVQHGPADLLLLDQEGGRVDKLEHHPHHIDLLSRNSDVEGGVQALLVLDEHDLLVQPCLDERLGLLNHPPVRGHVQAVLVRGGELPESQARDLDVRVLGLIVHGDALEDRLEGVLLAGHVLDLLVARDLGQELHGGNHHVRVVVVVHEGVDHGVHAPERPDHDLGLVGGRKLGHGSRGVGDELRVPGVHVDDPRDPERHPILLAHLLDLGRAAARPCQEGVVRLGPLQHHVPLQPVLRHLHGDAVRVQALDPPDGAGGPGLLLELAQLHDPQARDFVVVRLLQDRQIVGARHPKALERLDLLGLEPKLLQARPGRASAPGERHKPQHKSCAADACTPHI